jgi:hypothetical protein
MNGTHELLAYDNDVNLLGNNIDTIKKHKGSLMLLGGSSRNKHREQYMLLSNHQNAGQNHDTKTASSSFQNVTQFKYLIQEKI